MRRSLEPRPVRPALGTVLVLALLGCVSAPPPGLPPHRGAGYEFIPPIGFELVPRERVLRGSWGPLVPDEVWGAPTRDAYISIVHTDRSFPPGRLHGIADDFAPRFAARNPGTRVVATTPLWIHDRQWLRVETVEASGDRNLTWYVSALGRLLVVNFSALEPHVVDRYREPLDASIASFRILDSGPQTR